MTILDEGASSWGLAWRLALREMRGGLKGFRLFIACLALGAGAIAATGSLQASLIAGLEADGRRLLGGDIEVRLVQRAATADERAYFDTQGRVSATATMRVLAYGGTDARTLVELKAVDNAYPLFGQVALEPAIDLDAAFEEKDGLYGAAAEEALVQRLGVGLGDILRVGEGAYQIRAILKSEPDRIGDAINLGPRLLVNQASLDQTRLLQPGSLVYHHYRIALAAGGDARAARQALELRFPDAGWRLRDWRNSNPGLRQFVDRMALFILFAALASLLIGGVGVGNAVSHYLSGKTASIATLKAVGADRRILLRAFTIHMLILATIGVALGAAVGAAVPYGVAGLAAAVLPIALKPGLHILPLGIAILFGLLVAGLFTAWPLLRAASVRPAELYRERIAPPTGMRRRALIATGLCGIGLALALFLVAGQLAALPMGGGPDGSDVKTAVMSEGQWFALWFIGGSAAAFLILRLLAGATVWLLRRLPRPRGLATRLALSNLLRPGSVTISVLMSLGIGLGLISSIALIQDMIRAELVGSRPKTVPAFFIADIQPSQWLELKAMTKDLPQIEAIEGVPSLRGRITRVNGVPAEEVKVVASEQWVLRGDRGLTYASEMPPNNRLAEGEWWPADYAGEPLVSIEDEAMRGLGLSIGDTISVNVLGREITARVASSRIVEWGSLNLNFVLVFSPGVFEAAPQTWLATLRLQGDGLAEEEQVWRAVTDRFANMSVIRVREALQQAEGLIANIGLAIQGVGFASLLSGLFVLAGAIAAGQRARLREAALMKAIGADRAILLRACLIEYGLLGAIAAFYGLGVGLGAAWALSIFEFSMPFRVDPVLASALLIGPALVSALVGALGSMGVFRAGVNAYLRTA